jgi:hypothetical protein
LLVGLLLGTAAGVHLLFQEEARDKKRRASGAEAVTDNNDEQTGQ